VLSGARPAVTGTAARVTVSISRDPALVRTVRLVAAAVARRTTGDEDFVEEVRLAVGEACALLVGPDGEQAAEGPVEVSMRLQERLRVVVRAAGAVAVHDAPTSDIDGVEPWALLRGLIDDFEIHRDDTGTALSMSWPLP
jgi:anti-sigma regulatory factor (Ser/Thr protein kinase)